MSLLKSSLPEASKIIQAEMQSEDWIARNWRPLAAIGFVFTILFFALIEPVMVSWLGVPMVKPDNKVLEWTYQLATVCVGGYVVGRSLEKIVDRVMGRR